MGRCGAWDIHHIERRTDGWLWEDWRWRYIVRMYSLCKDWRFVSYPTRARSSSWKVIRDSADNSSMYGSMRLECQCTEYASSPLCGIRVTSLCADSRLKATDTYYQYYLDSTIGSCSIRLGCSSSTQKACILGHCSKSWLHTLNYAKSYPSTYLTGQRLTTSYYHFYTPASSSTCPVILPFLDL